MGAFLREQNIALTEYNRTPSGGCDALLASNGFTAVVEKVTINEDKFTMEFKSGVTVDVDE